MVNWTAFCQSSDSLATYPVPKYVLWRMAEALKRGEVCDTLQAYQEREIKGLLKLTEQQDSLLSVRRKEIENLSLTVEQWEARYEIADKVLQIERKETRKWKVLTFAGGVLFVMALAF